MRSGLLATFAGEDQLIAALQRLRAANAGDVETYTPKPVETGPSIVPALVLAAGVLGTIASFGLQTYADTLAYPLDVGGRPNLSWPAFVPIAFENGVLVAVVAAFLGFLFVTRLPRLYEPIDDCDAVRRATRDAWCIAIRTDNPDLARSILRDLAPAQIEELP